MIVARHMGMRVIGFSIVTDKCMPDALEHVTLETVIAAAKKAEPNLTKLIKGVLKAL